MKKQVFAALCTVLFLSATPLAVYAKDKRDLSCKITDVQLWEAPDLYGIEIWLGIRLTCRNTGKKTVRIKTNDVSLFPAQTPDEAYAPDRNRETFYTVYDEEPTPGMPRKFADLPANASADIAYVFVGGSPLTSMEGVLDLNGLKLKYKRPPTPTYFDVVSEEEKQSLDKHRRIWDYK